MKQIFKYTLIGCIVVLVFTLTTRRASEAKQADEGDGLVSRMAAVENRPVPVGTILAFGGEKPPINFLLCDGREYSKMEYPELFDVIGYRFGGDYGGKFRVPDLQGRVPIGVGTGTALSQRDMASSGGEERHQLTLAEMPQHSHGVSDPGHGHRQYAVANFGQGGTGVRTTYTGDGTGARGYDTGIDVNANQTGLTVNNAGESQSHNNMPPFLVVSYIIQF